MMTREEIREFDEWKSANGLSNREAFEKKGIQGWMYYRSKKKYAREDAPAGFLPVSTAGLPPSISPMSSGTRAKGKAMAEETWMTVELRTPSGTDMRLQGAMTPVMLYTILKSV